MPERALLAQAVAALLPPGAGIGWADPQVAYPLLPGECLPGAIPQRLREFSAGRHAARAALRQLGQPVAAIPMADDRAPVWPDGIVGSISHSRTACLAAAAPGAVLAGLGLDLAEDTALATDLWDTVLRAEERAALAHLPKAEAGLAAMMIFSAKEAAYKAQYPQSLALFGFDRLQVDLAGDRFTARFRAATPPFAEGDRIEGRILRMAGHFVTLAMLPPVA